MPAKKIEVHSTGDTFRLVVESVPSAIVMIDAEGTIVLVNSQTESLFGYRRSELVGQPVEVLVPEPFQRDHVAKRSKFIEQPQPRLMGKGRDLFARHKNGSEFPVEIGLNPVRTDDGLFVLSTIIDISERKRLEQSVQTERDFAEGLIETAHAIVLFLDPAGRIVRFNTFMEDLSGYRLEEVKGRDWFETFVPERERERIWKVFVGVLNGIPAAGTVNAILTKSGAEREIAWWDKVFRDDSSNVVGVLAIGHDITPLKEAQRRAVQAERLAAIGQMIAGLAHESRNALQRIQACAEMLELELEDNPDLLALVQRIQNAQDGLNRLFEEVRSYAGPMKLDRTQCDLSRVWREAWGLLADARRGRQCSLREEIRGVDLKCTVDAFRLVQVFRNLLENSLSACADPAEIVIACAHVSHDQKDYLEVAVRDNGPGLNQEQMARVFEPFYTTKTKGTGLGMPIAQRIVRVHGGEIEVGHPPRGAEFKIRLPRTN
jgi:hypothetical protein